MRSNLIGTYLACTIINVFDDLLVGNVQLKSYIGTSIAFALLAALDAVGVGIIAIPLGYLVLLGFVYWYVPGILATLK